MRIAFIWDWQNDLKQMSTWKDGLAAAVRILSQRHELKFFTEADRDFLFPHDYFDIHCHTRGDSMKKAVSDFNPDVILIWGDLTRPHIPILKDLGKPMALCFAGGSTTNPESIYLDHIFVESQEYKERFESQELSVSTAFGTNTELFQPIPDQKKYFDVIFPATYCDWKRHNLFTEATRGLKTVTAGFMYDTHETYCWQDTRKGGALTLPHMSAEALRVFYAASRVCLITSQSTGGSQRTVLEAMSMDIPVMVMEDSEKTSEYVKEVGWSSLVVKPEPELIRYWLNQMLEGSVRPRGGRDYVLSKWSEHHYADALEAGLVKLL